MSWSEIILKCTYYGEESSTERRMTYVVINTERFLKLTIFPTSLERLQKGEIMACL